MGAENCRKIARHPPVGQCHPVWRPLCLCRDGKEEVGGEVLAISLPGWPPTGFVGTHFPPATGSPVRAIRPSVEPDPLALLQSLDARGGTGLQGAGLLDCWTWQ